MKIFFSGDNHLYYGNQQKAVKDMMGKIREQKPNLICLLGDIGEVLIYDDLSLVQELFSFQPTLFVLGNHDLYSINGRYEPPYAMEECLKVLRWGIPLQTGWIDNKTSYEKDNVLFIGTIGFPDFCHPKMIMPIPYYDNGCPTIDATYMNLRGGWLQYTLPLITAFEKKLKLVDESKCSTIVIITHYPIFESQYHLNPTNEISVYFYCHKIGELVRQVAQRNSNKKFYCVAGHGHEYNLGRWIEMDNIYTHGLVTDYNQQKYVVLDL